MDDLSTGDRFFLAGLGLVCLLLVVGVAVVAVG
jgi:hypothetical protein